MADFLTIRANMPQIELGDYPDLMAYLHDYSVQGHPAYLKPDALKPSQRHGAEFDPARFDFDQLLQKPVLIASDLYILDGHHRVQACKLRHVRVRGWVLSAPASHVIPLLNAYPKVSHV